MCPSSVDVLVGIYLVTRWTVSPGRDWKYTFLIYLICVDLTGMNESSCRYLIKSVLFVMWYAMLIIWYMSLSSC